MRPITGWQILISAHTSLKFSTCRVATSTLAQNLTRFVASQFLLALGYYIPALDLLSYKFLSSIVRTSAKIYLRDSITQVLDHISLPPESRSVPPSSTAEYQGVKKPFS